MLLAIRIVERVKFVNQDTTVYSHFYKIITVLACVELKIGFKPVKHCLFLSYTFSELA